MILRKGSSITGLTTAATVWCSAAAGCLAAIGMYYELLLAVGLIVFINLGLEPIDQFIDRKFGTSKKVDDRD